MRNPAFLPDFIRPRFATHEDANRWRDTGDGSKAIPTHIQQGDRIVPNPEYESAPYEGDFVFHNPKAK
jgi:hypothetical protein